MVFIRSQIFSIGDQVTVQAIGYRGHFSPFFVCFTRGMYRCIVILKQVEFVHKMLGINWPDIATEIGMHFSLFMLPLEKR